MNSQKLLAVFMSILLIVCACIVVYYKQPLVGSASLTDENHSDDVTSEEPPVSHVVTGVPYVGQSTNFYCSYASTTILLLFQNCTTSLSEVLYLSGIGYSTVYLRIPGYPRSILPSIVSCQSPDTLEFLANLFGLSFELWYPTDEPKESLWDDYWSRVTTYVADGIPVITSVDPYTLPHLKSYIPPSKEERHSGHAVVIVGFNESNNTVCFHDPATGYWGDPERGTYVYLSQDIFQDAIENTTGTQYLLTAFLQNPTVSSFSQEERFFKAHERNINIMRGTFGIGLNGGQYTGMWSLRRFLGDLRVGVSRRATTVSQYSTHPIDYSVISIEKTNATQYLYNIKDKLTNDRLNEKCSREIALLEQEVSLWNQLSECCTQLYSQSQDRVFIGTLLFTYPTTVQMKVLLRLLLLTERAILVNALFM